MSAPSINWNEASPAGNTDLNLGDNRIREMKTQIREVIAVDHKFNSSGIHADNGCHNQVTLLEQADIGSGEEGKTILGSQTVSGKGELVYTDENDIDIQITKNGKLNASALGGTYAAPATVADLSNIMNFIYPVGSVVTLGVSTNPATLFGIGTWSAIAGRVIVGINTAIVGFDALNATGGEKTVTLTIDEIPEHGHDTIKKGEVSSLGGSAGAQWRIDSVAEYPSGLTGGGQEHENMPPFIVKYVWERVS